MTLTHVTAIRDTLADAVVDAIDVGSSDASGDVEIATSGAFTTILVTIALAAPPAFGASSSGTAAANSLPKEGTAGNGGTATDFRVRDRDNAEVFRGSVGTSGTDMILSSLTISVSDVIRINTFTYSASQ